MQPPGTLVEKQRVRVIIILQYITVWGGITWAWEGGCSTKETIAHYGIGTKEETKKIGPMLADFVFMQPQTSQ